MPPVEPSGDASTPDERSGHGGADAPVVPPAASPGAGGAEPAPTVVTSALALDSEEIPQRDGSIVYGDPSFEAEMRRFAAEVMPRVRRGLGG